MSNERIKALLEELRGTAAYKKLEDGIRVGGHSDDDCSCGSMMSVTQTRYEDCDYLQWVCIDECGEVVDRHNYHVRDEESSDRMDWEEEELIYFLEQL